MQKHDHEPSKLLYAPLVFLVISALFLPARTLSSATVSQRETDSGSIVATASSANSSSLFVGSSKGLRLRDWASLLSNNNQAEYYDNKPAKISGFVYDAGLGDDSVWLARFVLTCCAVDAQPVGVPVQITNWQEDYDEDQWVEVEGMFMRADTAKGEQILLVPESVKKIRRAE